jgi:hypothetical protein
MTNVPFLGLQPISLSVATTEEGAMSFTANETRLMTLTGTQTPDAALAQVEGLKAENSRLTSENETTKAALKVAQDAQDNLRALAVINKAIGENKPVAGLVEGYDKESPQSPNAALTVLTAKFGSVANAEAAFAALPALPGEVKGHGDPPPDEQPDDSDDDGIPDKALTVKAARKHFCAAINVTPEQYEKHRRAFPSLSERDLLEREGYTLVPSGKE